MGRASVHSKRCEPINVASNQVAFLKRNCLLWEIGLDRWGAFPLVTKNAYLPVKHLNRVNTHIHEFLMSQKGVSEGSEQASEKSEQAKYAKRSGAMRRE